MKRQKKINYAVVGLGHIAQVAVLPAFKNAENSVLKALVSADRKKLQVLSKKYKVPDTYFYTDFDACLQDGEIDAVYIALPNHLHYEYAIRAAEAGKHVLCEKPLAVNSIDAMDIIKAAWQNKVKLMTAYRLHLDPTNLKASQIVNSGQIGQLQYFISEFSHQVKSDNIRARPEEGGSPLHDLGIYCINASRYIMRAEPIEVFAMAANPSMRLPNIDQTVFVTMRFPGDRMAQFMCSFASTTVTNYRVMGSKGDLFIENVYEYTDEAKHVLTVNEKKKTWTTKHGDQFAAELLYFSKCILQNVQPEPSGIEGLIDLQIIEALMESMRTGRAVRLNTSKLHRRPTMRQAIKKPAHRKPELIHAEPES